MKSHGFLLPILLPLLLLSLAPPLHAETTDWLHEVRIGLLDHDTDGLWSGFKREDGVDLNAELIFSPSRVVYNGTLRPNLGVSINSQGDTSKVYAGGVWEYAWQNRWFVDLGLGIAAHNGETETRTELDKKELGTKVLFRVSIEAGYSIDEHHRLSILFDHISNAYIADPNEGMDTLGIRYGYRF